MSAVKPSARLLGLAVALVAAQPVHAFERLQTRGRRVSAVGDWLLVTAPERERVALYDARGEVLVKLGEFGGEQGLRPGFLAGPHGALALPPDELVVLDTHNQRLQAFDLRSALAGLRPRLRRVRGAPGRSAGRFDAPVSGLAVSPLAELEGLLFVGDTGNGRVQAFDRDWRFVRAFDVAGAAAARPSGLAFDRGGRVLYVGEEGAARVSAFDARDGRRLFSFDGCPGEPLAMPAGVAVDPAGDVLVADRVARRVRRLRPERGPDGQPRALHCVSSFGRFGHGPGEWQYPQSLAVDARGRIYVCDQADDRCQAFDAQGRFLFAFADDWQPPEWSAPAPEAPPLPAGPLRLCSGAGAYGVIVRGLPASPQAQAEIALDVDVTRGCRADAPAADDVDLRVDAWMPRHRHGLTTQPRVRRAGAGRFQVDGLVLQMSGLWELHFDLWLESESFVERAQWDLELP
jgi:sugar lactone lactonase YvrE